MEVRAFRAVMVLAMILFIALLAAGEPFQSLLTLAGDPRHQTMLLVTGGIVAGFWALCLVGFVGMYRFKTWGRSISLFTTIATYVLWGALLAFLPSAAGDSTSSPAVPLESLLESLSALFWGGALALAYLSPLATRFGANNSFKPTPLRGAA